VLNFKERELLSMPAPPISVRKDKGDRKEEEINCSAHYKRNGHTMEKCYKIHGYPGSTRQGGKQRTLRNANNAWTATEKTEEAAVIPSLLGLSQD